MALEEQLEGTRVTRKGDTSPQVAPPSSEMVAGGKQCASRSTITPTKTCSADLYRHIKRRVGCSLNERTAREPGPSQKAIYTSYLEQKAVFRALKEFQNLCQNSKVLIATDNTTVIAYINKWGGGVGLSRALCVSFCGEC